MMNAEPTRAPAAITLGWYLIGQAELPSKLALLDESGMEMWPYRRLTIGLLRRYARSSVEVGRLPSLLGREFFRSRVSSPTRRNFEDVVIFVADMEKALEMLSAVDKNLLAMCILEEYKISDIAMLLGCNEKTVRRTLPDAIDQLSRILLADGLLEQLAEVGGKSCQGGKNYKLGVSDSNKGKNKVRKNVQLPPPKVIS